MEEVLKGLNSAQREAVTHIDGPLLILAGAGSGKTKTLTVRLAYLIGQMGIDPYNILTLTFTSKAAKEMRSRAINMVGSNTPSIPLLCTFHKFGLIFLKLYIDKLGRKKNFVIIDKEDKKRILKKIAKENRINLTLSFNLSFISSEISKYKNSILSPEDIYQKAELLEYIKIAKIYRLYQEEIEEKNLVDFDDLLMLTYRILKENDLLRVQTSNRYKYIMVDEYQDTNELQFKLLKLLSSEHDNLCVVGDDDQSIYGWRGANLRNILEFEKHFKNAKIIKLEINYRSTNPILKAANELIEYNTQRIGKTLISHKGDGPNIKIFHYMDENMEARAIAKEIKGLLNRGVPSNEIAVLYRINALSHSLEDGFRREGLNFKLVGGIHFYDRAEIKDIISYFRVFANPNDDFSLERIINRPKRAIGKVTMEKLKKIVLMENSSLFSVIDKKDTAELSSFINKKAIRSLKSFIQTIHQLMQKQEESLMDFLELFEKKIGLKKYYRTMVDGDDRVLNIDEFYGYFREFITKNPHRGLESFLNEIPLKSEQDQVDNRAITIMTIHASKGLEFEHLYVIGLEEEFFPLPGDNCDMEEERRLGYVAITRAKKYLTLCYVNSRFYKGQRKQINKSPFLSEAGLIKGESFKPIKTSKTSKFKKGDLVKHKIFGIGQVQSANKSRKGYKLKINFGGHKKEILSSFVQSV